MAAQNIAQRAIILHTLGVQVITYNATIEAHSGPQQIVVVAAPRMDGSEFWHPDFDFKGRCLWPMGSFGEDIKGIWALSKALRIIGNPNSHV